MAIFKFGTTEPSLLHWQPWLSVCLLLGWGQTYADLVLIEDGQPRSTVVVGSQRSEKEHLAATELQNYLTKITGAKVPRARDTNVVAGPRILVGRSAASDRLSLEVAVARTEAHLRTGDGDTQEADAGGALRFAGVSPATTSTGCWVSLKRSTARVTSSRLSRQLVPAARS